MDPRIVDFIREHRTRLTRDAITRQLEDAGHARADIDRTWERLAAVEPIDADTATPLGWYVWGVYALGAVAIAVYSGMSGLNVNVFSVGWMVAYLVLAWFPARALARKRTSSGAGVVAILVLAPLVVILIGGGICAATVLVVLQSLGY